jgi:hypothetical protein
MKSARIGAFAVVLAVAAGFGPTAIMPNAAQNERTIAKPGGILSLTYHMTGSNQKWRYAIDANSTAKKDGSGKFYEEYAWSGMISDSAAYSLPAASQQFRQKLSLRAGRFAVGSGFEPRRPENNRTDHGSSDHLQ